MTSIVPEVAALQADTPPGLCCFCQERQVHGIHCARAECQRSYWRLYSTTRRRQGAALVEIQTVRVREARANRQGHMADVWFACGHRATMAACWVLDTRTGMPYRRKRCSECRRSAVDACKHDRQRAGSGYWLPCADPDCEAGTEAPNPLQHAWMRDGEPVVEVWRRQTLAGVDGTTYRWALVPAPGPLSW